MNPGERVLRIFLLLIIWLIGGSIAGAAAGRVDKIHFPTRDVSADFRGRGIANILVSWRLYMVATRNSLKMFGWEAGIRTPIGGFRVRSPTVRRPPSRRNFNVSV